MSDSATPTPTTPKQFLAALLGGLFAPLIAIALIVGLVVGIQQRQVDDEAVATNDQAVRERIAPVGTSVAAAADASRAERNGEEVYNGICASCHGSGVLGAPKYQDKAGWSKRIAQGYDKLVEHAINGLNAMPARGGAADLTDTEVARAVVYMANAAGAKFEMPAAADETAEAAPAASEATPPAAAEAGTPAAPAATAAPTAAVAKAEAPAAAPAPKAAAGKSGEEVYKSACAACHGTGVLGAPKHQDKAAWSKRIAAGYKTMLNHALNGINTMPPRGGVSSLSDQDVARAVVYMANAAGANFQAP